ncbi:pyridoxamine 5'-phosphate oxidase family protein [Thalassospira sp. HF15]|uniref:pyridoxamine 5'-phosphate oxidase family protein n=1 Tax=Thalassospira sp. HF15 TaxID=2722755 RepID=UPI00142FF6B3|nr:pyridoxamine 5'-phosphate oxidase family protein [Thalassospira sp. HF15]NIY77474.1 pyridoxamine 5'-phosphate oxidase family protein [Thalassospira sp. HF15]
MSDQYQVHPHTKVVRGAKRASYDRDQVHAIIDDALICHVGTVVDGRPAMIPTAHWRGGGRIYIHGASKNRILAAIAEGAEACLCITHLDGLVMARSAFHHSANYRSVVIYGKGTLVADDAEKMEHSRLFTEKLEPGRWEHIREPNKQELKATMFIGFDLDQVSAKIRAGDPVDDEEDYDLGVWAGVLPCRTTWGAPVDDARIKPGFEGKGYQRS